MLMLAITVTITMEVVSELLIVSMVIASTLNRTPESMVLAATVISSVSAFMRFLSAYIFDMPARPPIANDTFRIIAALSILSSVCSVTLTSVLHTSVIHDI